MSTEQRESPQPGTDREAPRLRAFALQDADRVKIAPAPRMRDWMPPGFARSAKKCLPLMVANQHGWLLHNPTRFVVSWNGEPGKGSLRYEWPDGKPWPLHVDDSFGGGAVSFRIPYLFRTSPGWNLLVRGPSNFVKDGVVPLEGLVEADWAVATFTMNWVLTRPNSPVTFEAGEPICMLVPQRRGDLELFDCTIEELGEDEDTERELRTWSEERRQQLLREFLAKNAKEDAAALDPQALLYFRGRYPSGGRAEDHNVALHLPEFADHRKPGAGSSGHAAEGEA